MMMQIKISDPRSLRPWHIKGSDESTPGKDSSIHLIYHDPSDLKSATAQWPGNPRPTARDGPVARWPSPGFTVFLSSGKSTRMQRSASG